MVASVDNLCRFCCERQQRKRGSSWKREGCFLYTEELTRQKKEAGCVGFPGSAQAIWELEG